MSLPTKTARWRSRWLSDMPEQTSRPRREMLEVAFPEATSKVAVFIHGLGETEESWRLHADRHGVGTESTYGSRLALDLGYTPVYLRYNTGLHISENGQHLTALLDDVVAAWPTTGRRVDPGGSLDGWAGRPQRLPLCTAEEPLMGIDAAPRLLPGHSTSGGGTRAVGPKSQRRARQARREPAARYGPRPAQRRNQGSARRISARRGLAACGPWIRNRA